MSVFIYPNYQFDNTSSNNDNLVVDELHPLLLNGARILVPRHGVAYTKDLIVQPSAGGSALRLGIDFNFVSIDTYLTTLTGHETFSAIEVKNDLLAGNMLITYRAVGGVEGASNKLMHDLIDALDAISQGGVNWADIINKPALFPVGDHDHPITQLTELQLLSNTIADLRQALVDSRPLQLSSLNLIAQDERILQLIANLDNRVNLLFRDLKAYVDSKFEDNQHQIRWLDEYNPSLGLVGVSQTISVPVKATSQLGDEFISYNLTQGTLPVGITLNGTTGVLEGTVDINTPPGGFNIRIQADDGFNAIAKLETLNVGVITNDIQWLTDEFIIGITGVSALFLDANDINGNPITYNLEQGTLPQGLTLNPDGTITGNISADNNTYVFTASAFSASGYSFKEFRLFLHNGTGTVIWDVSAISGFGALVEGQVVSESILAQSIVPGNTITYSISAGALPPGIVLNQNGTFTGTTTNIIIDTPYSFTVRADDGVTLINRIFIGDVQASDDAPYWITPADLGFLSGAININLQAEDPELQPISYAVTGGALPGGVSLGPGGTLTGNITDDGLQYTFIVTASDGLLTASRSFSFYAMAPVVIQAGDVIDGYRIGQQPVANNGETIIWATVDYGTVI